MAHRYQQQESPLTLAEGLAEYYAANRGVVARPADLPPESSALFRNHDMCHVIFGLDTSLADETMVDARTLLSCDVGVRRYARYLSSDQQAKALFKALGVWRATVAIVRALPRILRAVRETWRMPKRWPWTPPGDYQDRRLADLRNEYGIRVI